MPFDPEQFRRRFPGRPFPDIRFRSERERWEADQALAARYGPRLGGPPDGGLLWTLFDRARPLNVAPAPASEAFHLTPLLGLYELRAGPEVCLDWYMGEQVAVGFRDLVGSFGAFWQPGADDMALFPGSCDWVLYFTRDGGVRLLRADEGWWEQE